MAEGERLGSIGDVNFTVSSLLKRTFKRITGSGEAIYADHQVIGQKPVSEFTGLDLTEREIEISLNAAHGINPLEELEKLCEMRDGGEPHSVVLFGKVFGDYTIRSVDEEIQYTLAGRPLIIDVTLIIKEFITTVPSEAQMKMREEELKRGDTGKGGPQRLPGSPAPEQKRDMQIDPETRMPV